MKEDVELEAMSAVVAALGPLEAEAQARVLRYASQRFRVSGQANEFSAQEGNSGQDGGLSPGENTLDGFKSFADLYDRTRPTTDPYRALVGGYWLQVAAGATDFESYFVNKELENLGHKIGNVTNAFTRLSSQKPVLAMQVRKSGKSAQARKKYRLTEAGIKIVEEMSKREKE